jgi:cell fate (sporulation/competence/biofilm development) regulator YmcA (YheA/YmcA/DUF963 family)
MKGNEAKLCGKIYFACQTIPFWHTFHESQGEDFDVVCVITVTITNTVAARSTGVLF